MANDMQGKSLLEVYGIPDEVGDDEPLARKCSCKNITKLGSVKPQAFQPTKFPLSISVNRETYHRNGGTLTEVVGELSSKGKRKKTFVLVRTDDVLKIEQVIKIRAETVESCTATDSHPTPPPPWHADVLAQLPGAPDVQFGHKSEITEDADLLGEFQEIAEALARIAKPGEPKE